VQQFILAFRDGEDEYTEIQQFAGFEEALRHASDTLMRLAQGRPSVQVALGECTQGSAVLWLGTVHVNDARKPVWAPEGGLN
jgi:hypothetical protein